MDRKIAIFDQQIFNFLSAVNFVNLFVIKIRDPDWIWIRIGIQPNMLDSDLDQMNTDPKH